MLFQLFRDSYLMETKIGWMVSFAKLLNEDCVQMFFILMTSRVMLISNYFVRPQTLSAPTPPQTKTQKFVVLPQKSRTQLHIATYSIFAIQKLLCEQMSVCYNLTTVYVFLPIS